MSNKLPFSVRMGLKAEKSLQLDRMDNELRTGLWNALYKIIYDEVPQNFEYNTRYKLMDKIFVEVLNKPLDEIGYNKGNFEYELKKYITKSMYYEVYDMLENINQILIDGRYYSSDKYKKRINIILEKYNSAFRFIGDEITPISDETEIQGIQDALDESNGRFSSVYTHLSTALKHLSDRENPDYRNSMKESISAVEAMCKLISGDPNADLGKALAKIEKDGKVKLHSALKVGYNRLYDYTSDVGVRHGMKSDPNLDFEDAKYILVSCSAFINYLIVKADKAGIF